MQSGTTTFALIAWPFIAAVLFSVRPPIQAILWTIVGAQLLLPVGEGIKFEMIPQFDKASIPNLCIFFGFLIVSRQAMRFPRFGLAEILVLIFVLGPIATSLLNGDTLFIGDRILSGVGIYDAGSAVGSAIITLMPFFVGRRLLRSAQANQEVLRVLIVAGLLYSILLLFEIRFSPQLHFWVYGYYPSDFIQAMRGDGYRPMVFMGHGLIAAIFLFMSVVAATAFWRTNTRIWQMPPSVMIGYLGVVFVLCKSLGAAAFGAVVAPLVGFTKPAFQSRVAVGIVLVAVLYPMLRFADLIPTRAILDNVYSVSADREGSLGLRFENEERLLEHALRRPFFGWGRYGRSRVYDSETGNDVTVTDGRWIITFGQFGILGFIAEFGLLALCVIRAALAQRYPMPTRDRIFLSALALIVSTNVLDNLPNASLLPLTWLFAGALLGRAEALREAAQRRRRVPAWGAETAPVAGRSF